ncbi:hypothetical protein AYO40_06875 [Planctomycetaceae bacterium SCGC AG-212-D15]|nr:hypothetical protein AYO40_06875 [Planctomycetaceae bacterium SCGC AG-212-D15]
MGEAGGWRRDIACVLVLLLLAAGLRAWNIGHTAVAARDSIGFIRYAWRLEHEPWTGDQGVLRTSLHPPLYPVTVLLTSLPVRAVLSSADCLTMQYSAQIACALAGVLLVIPMFYLGGDLFDRRVGFGSAALFQCMPIASHALSDGLTEGLYLLLMATFLLVAGRALKTRSLACMALCGLLCGLAYLTRPEGAALAGVLGAILVVMQFRRRLRWPLRRFAPALVLLPALALAVSLPYMLAIGGFSNKLTPNLFFKAPLDTTKRVEAPEGDTRFTQPLPIRIVCGEDRAGVVPLFAAWEMQWKGVGIGRMTSFAWALKVFVKEVGKGFHYIFWVPGFLGLGYFLGRARSNPTAWVVLALAGLYIAVFLRMALIAGYMSERHAIVFVLFAAPWMVAGILEGPVRLMLLCQQLRLPDLVIRAASGFKAARIALLVLLAVYCLPSSLQALHPTRVGFREAGFWLAEHADPSAKLLDPFCWTEYYAGRVFTAPPPEHAPTRYVVLDDIYSFDHHSHLPAIDEAKRLAQQAELIYHWPQHVRPEEALVKIYALDGR